MHYAFRASEHEAEQKYQDKLRLHDQREDRARKQEEGSVARATDALEKAVAQREKAEAAIVKATALLSAAKEALSVLDTTRDEKNTGACNVRDKANEKARTLRDTTLAALESVFQEKLTKATCTRDDAMQSEAVRELQAQVCALDSEMAKELSFEVNRSNYQKDSDDSDSSDDVPLRKRLTKSAVKTDMGSSAAASDTEDADTGEEKQVCVTDGEYEQPRTNAPPSIVYENGGIDTVFNEWEPEACTVDRRFATEGTEASGVTLRLSVDRN